MKKLKNIQILPILIIIILVLLVFSIPSVFCENSDEDLINDLEDNVYQQLVHFDFGDLDDCISLLGEQSKSIFGSQSFFDKVSQLINGDFGVDTGSFLGAFASCFFGEVVNFLPLLCVIIMVTVLCSLIGNIRSDIGAESVGRIINFVCFGIVVVVTSGMVFALLNEVGGAISSIKLQMDVIFPILLTLLASVGGAVTVGIFQPTLALLGNVVVQIFNFVLIPLFTFAFIFAIVGNLSDSVSLNKFNSLFKSIFKWVAGICFSVFMGLILVQGVVAGNFDNVSIRATKFALKSYVPILGGYLSDGFNLVMASSVLIKNAIGGVGIFLALCVVLVPIAKIAVLSLGLKLTASILEPMTKSKIPNYLSLVAKNVNMLLAIIAGVGFMYIVSVGMLLVTANLG